MIRGIPHGLATFLDDTYDVIVREIQVRLHPSTAPTTRAVFEGLVDLLEFRITRFSADAIRNPVCSKEEDLAYVRALSELRDEFKRWLDATAEVKT